MFTVRGSFKKACSILGSFQPRWSFRVFTQEQEACLSEIKFSTGLAEGVIATYGMLGFTVPHFIISGTDTPCEQLERKLKEQFPKGLEVDKDSELGKQIAAAIQKLEGLMPEMQLICKENPREDPKAAADHKQTIVLKATLMSAAACAIKENTEDLSKMIDKAEASLKEDGDRAAKVEVCFLVFHVWEAKEVPIN